METHCPRMLRGVAVVLCRITASPSFLRTDLRNGRWSPLLGKAPESRFPRSTQAGIHHVHRQQPAPATPTLISSSLPFAYPYHFAPNSPRERI
ncbi:hypothetical protein LSTR_LSTR004541 [Laodelphax striatellus]|uniref:Uncharacterized protein n=1 Tax=Laodelphax striatellus TaxID=195883 RepID=A0A482WTM0_LAOST|nr:hypothetical protein LSTR_LSTR004541 [Laodelphax striatellus]